MNNKIKIKDFNEEDYNSDYKWEDFIKSRDELMHVISVEDFFKKYDLVL